MIADSVGFCAACAAEVIYDAEHFFDGYKRNPDYALRTLQAAAAAGAAWIVLCDTNGGSLPEEIAAAVSIVGREIHVPLGIHTHNDGDLAVANALTAVQHGARQVQGTVNGLGERCGNVDLCSVLGNLALKYPGFEVLSPGKLEHLTELSRYVYETANMNFRPNQPFVGASAFAHKGGMHVHGVRKNATTYEHVIPAAVGNERRVLISELSGKSSVALKLKEYGLEQDGSFHALVLDRVQELENEGYQFEASDGSFVLLVERLAKRHRAWFEPLGYHVSVNGTLGLAPSTSTEATIKLRGRRPTRAYGQRGRRPGQRTRRRPAEGTRGPFSASQGNASGRLQSTRHQRARRDGGTRPGRDREQGPRRCLGNRRRFGKCHRGELAGSGRLIRIQTGPGLGSRTSRSVSDG